MRALITTALIVTATAGLTEPKSITADIWADNWFAMYANGDLIIEDSIPITTERSFNAETTTFTAELPITIAFEVRDFKANDTGLEYIGTSRQQMGDGGLIAQFLDATTGETVAVTNTDVRCLVIHRAPIDRACENESSPIAGVGPCGFVVTQTPTNWTTPNFDDRKWPNAVRHSEWAVGPKDGYDTISWNWDAKLIWSDDLVQDNTLLCRLVIGQ